MDFCVKCGKKELYEESLCRRCYEHEYPTREKKVKLKKDETAKHPGYYESILQLRNPDKKVMKFVDEIMRGEEKVKVAKVEGVRNGYDFYLSDLKSAQKIGKLLQNKFGGLIKSSVKLYSVSRITSKLVYRLTVLYRKPSFEVGDWVTIKGEKVKVKKMGRELIGNLESGKKVKYSFKELARLRVI